MTEWLRLIRYTSSVIVARSARPCRVLLPDLLPVRAKDCLQQLVAVPDLQHRTLELDVDAAPSPGPWRPPPGVKPRENWTPSPYGARPRAAITRVGETDRSPVSHPQRTEAIRLVIRISACRTRPS